MAKDPAFLFYPNDYIGGTMGMTFEEKGAYVELLMTQFNSGHMALNMIENIVGKFWEKIKHKFEKDSKGLYFNRRLQEEQLKRKAYSSSRKNNLKGKNQHKKKVGHMTSHVPSHMEDVNKDSSLVLNRPTLKEINDYVEKNNKLFPNIDTEKYFMQRQSIGWIKASGVPIVDWKADMWNCYKDDWVKKPKKSNQPYL